MENYKKSPLWRNAYRLGKCVHELTKGAHPANTVVRLLREASEALIITIGISLENDDDALKDIFEHAHITEHLLFLSLFFHHLKADEKTADLFTRIHAIKRDLVAMLDKKEGL